MTTSHLLSTAAKCRARPGRTRGHPAVFFVLWCGLAFASSLLSVDAEADDSPIAVAIGALP